MKTRIICLIIFSQNRALMT